MAKTLPDAMRMHPLPDRLLPFDEAKRLVLDQLAPTLRTETLPLLEAHGRVLAVEVRAPMDVPAFDRSAMDGYAVQAADTQSPHGPLRLTGAAHAGTPFAGRVGPGECVQIATGAPIPEGADAVVMVERTRREGTHVWMEQPVKARENVSLRGADLARGTVALPSESLLTPARLGVLASLGVTKVSVYVRPVVGLLSTGTELREPGTPVGPGQIYDSNSTALCALLTAHGARVERSGIVPDDPAALRAALARFRHADLVLVTGSSSAGEHDYLLESVRSLGSLVFHGVAVKPGKPLLLARLWGKPVIGLAGNPASCLMMSYTLVVPGLRRFQRLGPDWQRRVHAKLAHPIPSPVGRRHFVPVRVQDEVATSVYKESDATTSVSAADGYIEIPDEVPLLSDGETVVVQLF